MLTLLVKRHEQPWSLNRSVHLCRHVDVGFVGRSRGCAGYTIWSERHDVHLTRVGIVEGAEVGHRGAESFFERHAEAEEGDDAVSCAGTKSHLAATSTGSS